MTTDQQTPVLEAQPDGYPVAVVAADTLEEVEELPPAMTLDQAKAAATARGYQVIDVGEGGNCETTDAWSGSTAHVVTVEEG